MNLKNLVNSFRSCVSFSPLVALLLVTCQFRSDCFTFQPWIGWKELPLAIPRRFTGLPICTSEQQEMNLRSFPTKPVIYLMSGTQQIADLVRRLAGILDCDTVLTPAAAELPDRISGSQPSCIVMPLEGACPSAETILRKLPDLGLALPSIVITGDLPVDVVVKIMELGAFKVLYKTFSPEMLRTFIEQALQLDAKRLDMKQHFLETQYALSNLTDRQLLVLREILEGRPTKAIAIELGASTRVIEKERSEILLAFHVKSTAEVTFRIGEYRVLRRMKNRFDPPHLKTHSPHYGANTSTILSQTAYDRYLERFGEL